MSLRTSACLAILSFSLLLPAAVAADDCLAQPQWFTGVPQLPTFKPRGTCQFQQWSWQAFLALLGTDGGRPTARYFTWDLPKPDITNLYCNRVCGLPTQAPKNPCGGPPTQEVVNAITQPGFVPAGTSGAVVDQAGEPVYFTAHVNPEWVDFITRNQLYDPKAQARFDPRASFPAGAFEIKSSWRIAEGMSTAEKAQYYTTTACVVPEDDPKNPRTRELALVGFHITGGAPDHPELLWATFEHVRNAPDCEDTPAPGAWALYDGHTNCRGGGPCNRPNAAGGTDPVNVCRQYPYGGAAPRVAREIADLNRDVQAGLPRDSKLRFYELVGTVWAANPTPKGVPTVNLQEPEGSPLLANTTLETFKQNVSCFGCHNSQFPGELAGLATPPSITLRDKTVFVSHIVLFPFFFETAGCARTCTVD